MPCSDKGHCPYVKDFRIAFRHQCNLLLETDPCADEDSSTVGYISPKDLERVILNNVLPTAWAFEHQNEPEMSSLSFQ